MKADANTHLVGISISNSAALAQLGYGEEHLHELMIAIARTLLRLGTPEHPVHLAYGGDLRPGGFTETLFDLYRTENQAGKEARLYSYLAWPYYLDLSKSDEAQRLNICHFLRITPADAGFPEYASDTAANALAPEVRDLLTARCISQLRETMNNDGARKIDGGKAPSLAARVILGGKTAKYTGIMPGLFEEFMLAQEHGTPIFIAGGFGGASAALADAVLNDSGELPVELSLDYQKKHTKELAALETLYLKDRKIRETPQARYDRLADSVAAYRADLFNPRRTASPARNGLDLSDNQRLMRSQSVTEITGFLEKGLRLLWSGAD